MVFLKIIIVSVKCYVWSESYILSAVIIHSKLTHVSYFVGCYIFNLENSCELTNFIVSLRDFFRKL